ncbi:hypothetical protein [Streptomyces sp. NEAU-W12]|uniref:hypothetical protein n=1 Tax=Streptomyces sp. NEAU-W12 TaxID=2994668 RepID=UPI00224AADDD|nr:hypothetical protein [Streptomyces sp. NEAU-W12]MCX2927901.1 hypothetical protein [Streptomyces sp. NEAU-W12]
MHMTRTGIVCPLCQTLTKERVYLVFSHQSPGPQRVVTNRRWCPTGCHLTNSEQWKETTLPFHGVE